MNAGLANSDGWMLNPMKRNQEMAPFTSFPSRNSSSNESQAAGMKSHGRRLKAPSGMRIPMKAMISEMTLNMPICRRQADVPGSPLAKLDTRKMPVMKRTRSVRRSRNVRLRLNELDIWSEGIYLMLNAEC